MTLSWLLWLPPLLIAAGVYVLARVGLEGTVDLGTALRRRGRWRAPRVLWLPSQALNRGLESQKQDSVARRHVALPPACLPASPACAGRQQAGAPVCVRTCLRRVLRGRQARTGRGRRTFWLGVGAGLVLAVLWRHAVLSPWFLALGGATGWMFFSTRREMGREDLRELETFVSALRSIFSVGQSVFASLAIAAGDLEAGPLQEVVQEAVRRYNADPDTAQALSALREAGWPYLGRLALVLEQVASADDETMRQALLGLETQVRRSRQLRDRAQTTLTLTRLTLRVLQAANLAALAAVTVIPLWRGFYVGNPLALVAATAMMLGGSWYFAGEIKKMEQLL